MGININLFCMGKKMSKPVEETKGVSVAAKVATPAPAAAPENKCKCSADGCCKSGKCESGNKCCGDKCMTTAAPEKKCKCTVAGCCKSGKCESGNLCCGKKCISPEGSPCNTVKAAGFNWLLWGSVVVVGAACAGAAVFFVKKQKN